MVFPALVWRVLVSSVELAHIWEYSRCRCSASAGAFVALLQISRGGTVRVEQSASSAGFLPYALPTVAPRGVSDLG